jgi:hypothetical protein
VSVPEIGAEFAGSGAPREGGGAGAPMGVLRAHQKYVVRVRPAGQRSQLCLLVLYTLLKIENQISLMYKEIQNGAVAKSYYIRITKSSYMGKCLRISSYNRKPFLIYDCSTLNFLIYEENFIFSGFLCSVVIYYLYKS